jgi:hypothetical protein
MAENKEIVVKLTVDTKGTESGLDSVKSDLKGVEDGIKKINETPLSLDEKLKKITKEVNAGGLSMRELTGKIKEYQTIALQAGRESPIGREAIKQAASLQDQLGDLRNEITRLSADGQKMQGALALGSAVAGGYGALQGVMALAGQENEALMQSLVKMQAAQSVLAGIEQVRLSLEKESVLMLNLKTAQTKIATGVQAAYGLVVGTTTGGLKLLKLAMVSTGIGALIVGIGLLIANFESVSKWVLKVADVIYSIFKPQIDFVIGILQFLGLVDDENTKKAKSNAAAKIKAVNDESKAQRAKADAIMKASKDEIAAIDSTIKKLDFELAVRQAGGEDIKELERQRIDLILERVRVEKEALESSIAIYEQNIALLEKGKGELEKAMNVELFINKQSLKAKKEELAENTKMGEQAVLDDAVFKAKEVKAAKDALEEKSKAEKEAANAKAKARKEANEKLAEEERKFAEKQRIAEANAQAKLQQDLSALEDEYLNSKLSKEQQEINAVYDKYFAILEAAKKNGEDISLLEEAQAESVKSIREKYQLEIKDAEDKARQEKEAKDKEADEKQKKLEKEALDQKIANINQVGEYASQGFDILSNLSSAFSKDSEKDARRQFNINKAAGIAQATTSTASAVVAQLAVPQDALTGANFVKAGIAGAIGISQIAKIAATKFQPGGGGGGGGDKIPIPSIASGGANGGTGGQSQQNDNLTNIAQLLNQQGAPVLVVDSFNKVDRAAEKIKTVASI